MWGSYLVADTVDALESSQNLQLVDVSYPIEGEAKLFELELIDRFEQRQELVDWLVVAQDARLDCDALFLDHVHMVLKNQLQLKVVQIVETEHLQLDVGAEVRENSEATQVDFGV